MRKFLLLIVIAFFVFLPFYVSAQEETQPVEKQIEVQKLDNLENQQVENQVDSQQFDTQKNDVQFLNRYHFKSGLYVGIKVPVN